MIDSAAIRIRLRLVLGAAALSVALAFGASSASSQSAGTIVHVQRGLSVAGDVRIGFRPTIELPAGGYYYAVIVLEPYRRYTRAAPPPCAVSSDMSRTDYGYAHGGRPVSLVLTRTASAAHRWCRGGTYLGGIYAVPKPPPCDSAYPCRSESYEASPCFEIEPGHTACGVVARPRQYAYPDGLPAPLAKGTRIVGYFRVAF